MEQGNQNNLNQLSKLQSQNQSFSQSLNAVLTATTDKLISQVKADTIIALQEHMATVSEAIQGHTTIMDTAYTKIETAAAKVIGYDTKLKATLDKRIKAYNSSIQRLFQVDGWQKGFFWAGIAGSILTPIMLIISRFL
jgi:2-oxoglutarate dehydrogenase complex dehydrogenase (E1) component-like enzyme